MTSRMAFQLETKVPFLRGYFWCSLAMPRAKHITFAHSILSGSACGLLFGALLGDFFLACNIVSLSRGMDQRTQGHTFLFEVILAGNGLGSVVYGEVVIKKRCGGVRDLLRRRVAFSESVHLVC
jgi:hypothetical protein